MLFLLWSIKLGKNKTITRTSVGWYSETLNLNLQSFELRTTDKRQRQYKN